MKSRTYYFNIYKKFKKISCEKCFNNKNLIVHHLDDDMTNNVPQNLQTLCRRCHQIEHKCWLNFPKNLVPWNKLKPQKCKWCTKEFIRHGGNINQKFCSRHCFMKNRNSIFYL